MKKMIRLLLKTILVIFILLNVVVAFNAYKFTHFYDRNEITIKPESEKNCWDKTKQILFGINAVKQQNQVADSNFETVILTTEKGLKLEAWMIPIDSSRGTVILFHGHGSKKSAVLNEASEFRKMGYNTFLLDFRAHGSSEGNTTTIGYYESEDVKLAYDYVRNSGEKNIVLYGISMGASTITKAIHDYTDIKPAAIILDMPFGSMIDAVHGRIKMMHLPVEPLSTLLAFWGGTEHGFWAFGFKPYKYAAEITCPVLLQRGKNDPRVSQEETDVIYANIKSQKKFVLYENSAHESLCKNENTKWVSEVAAFLR